MKSRKLLITDMPYGGKNIRVSCLTSDFTILEARCEYKNPPYLLGGIYIARVQKVLKNINAAFVDIAPGVSCYYFLDEGDMPLSIEEIHRGNSNIGNLGGDIESLEYTDNKEGEAAYNSRHLSGKIISEGFDALYRELYNDVPNALMPEDICIRRSLKAGEEIVVQVNRDALKSKEPAVTGRLELPGRYCVVKLGSGTLGISSKLTRQQKEHFSGLLEGHIKKCFDVIIRTNAGIASDRDVLDEVSYLSGKLIGIIKNSITRVCYTCLYKPDPQYISMIGDIKSGDIDEIVTDIPWVYDNISGRKADYHDTADIPVRFYEDNLLPLYKLYSIEKQFENALSPWVWLKSGGYIIIEKTEALTSIDVNTGKSVSKKAMEEHFFRTNLEAACEIARQIRLRNISGIILIDFINMRDKKHTEDIILAVKEAVKHDPVQVDVHDMTELGLLEITRKKVRKSLSEQLT